jgi:hypothetical protein
MMNAAWLGVQHRERDEQADHAAGGPKRADRDAEQCQEVPADHGRDHQRINTASAVVRAIFWRTAALRSAVTERKIATLPKEE